VAPRSRSTRQIATFLSRADPVLARVIRRTGAKRVPQAEASFESLAQTIVNQQISGKAGEAIVNRLLQLHGGRRFPPPNWFLETSAEKLRSAGLSPQKTTYVKDLAFRVSQHDLEFRKLPHLSDEEVIRTLTAVKGIGLWSAQMCLMFSLNRPDVLPTGDLGIRKAVARLWGYQSLPAESTVRRHGKRWAPFRSHASFYLWMSLDLPLGRGNV